MSREEALATLEEGRARVDALVAVMPDEDFERPRTIGGGDWSARDLVCHLAHWEELAQAAADDWRAGKEPAIEAVFRNQTVDDINAENDARSRDLSAEQVRERAARAHAAITGTIALMSDEEWSQKAPYEAERRRTLGILLASILGAPKQGFGHAFAHIPDLEAYAASLTH
ncbi:MAG: hypothetical protein QOK05_2865 [Chloroflexota bacterium]|jgi:hypothetical protein|nr:hypothetical protein [Chloroflexota bacterium]